MSPVSDSWHEISSRETSACVAASLCASDDNSELRPRSDLVPVEPLFSFGQLGVSQSFSSSRVNKTIQSFQRVALYVTSVQPESKFVNVATQVLGTDLVIDAVQPALENCPNTLNPVYVDRAASVHAFGVVDCGVSKEKPVKARVRTVFVSVERGADFDIVEQALLHSAEVVSFNRERFGTARKVERWKLSICS